MSHSHETNFPPDLWGPGMWFTLHAAALRYPARPSVADKNHMYGFITNLQYVLPCTGCCVGMGKILEMTTFGAKDLASSDALFAWTVKAHSIVNEKTGKPARNDWQKWKKSYLALSV